MNEQIQTGMKKPGRGMAIASLDLIAAMYAIARDAQPITPRDLRECVEEAIRALIEPVAWARCETVNAAELESIQTILSSWKGDR